MLEEFRDAAFSGPAGQDLHMRATGRFYTPQVITTELIDQVVSLLDLNSGVPLRVVDPFCGDGRLVVALIQKLSQQQKRIVWEISLWDCDQDAVRLAAQNVERAVYESGGKAKITASAVDSFEHAQLGFDRFDVVITNPPWETLKPDRRELEFLPALRRATYTKSLRRRADLLAEWFPRSQPTRKFSGWGTNLARVGTEVALRLCHPDRGICGIVSPASLLGDQVSSKLREWLFSQFSVGRISFFPAEGRFFENVDQPVIALSMRVGVRNQNSVLRIFDQSGSLVGTRNLDLNKSTLEANQFTVPIQFGPDAIDVLAKFQGLPIFGALEGVSSKDLWAGRELDETGRARYLATKGVVRFAKGQMVTRYSTSLLPKVFVNPAAISIPTSSSHLRIGWRDVSRPNQKRRMQASMIPKNWAAGNSLHVAYFRDDNHDKLFALLALMNSLVFEFQVRARLATAHISLGVVQQGHLPALDQNSLVKSLASVAQRCLNGDGKAHAKAEVAVAKAYGLNRTSFRSYFEYVSKA